MARILVVEDTPAVRETLELMIADAGHETEVAENGRVALRRLREDVYDLVITDVIMPDLDGNEVILETRKLPTVPKIIAISGGGLRVDKDEALMLARSQADATLKKPFTHQELQAALNGVLAASAA